MTDDYSLRDADVVAHSPIGTNLDLDFTDQILDSRICWNMNAGEASVEDVPITAQEQQQQQQQQERSHQQQTRKKDDDDKLSTAEPIKHQQLKPNQLHRPSGSSMSSVESIEVVHVRRLSCLIT